MYNAIKFYNSKEYDLIAFTIMPNHVHIVFTPIVGRFSESSTSEDAINMLTAVDNVTSGRNRVSPCTTNVGRFSESSLNIITQSEKTGTLADESFSDPDKTVPAGRSGISSYIVTKILQDLKKFTARECNKILARSGAFWQHESYDHVVRNESELKSITEYVLNNPVKAGLCDAPEKWKWNYANHLNP